MKKNFACRYHLVQSRFLLSPGTHTFPYFVYCVTKICQIYFSRRMGEKNTCKETAHTKTDKTPNLSGLDWV